MSNSPLPFAAIDDQLGARLASELVEVSRVFDRQLVCDLPAVNRLCLHIERYRGKMLRPTLVLLAGLATAGVARSAEAPSDGSPSDWDDAIGDRHRVVAAVTEMIHMATLVHDDVLDEAQVRRRGSTVNHLHGNEAAVMLGDYLISNAFHLCSSLGDPAINVMLGEVTNTLCAGELLQLDRRDDLSLDEPTYFEIVRRKTAVLVGACCRLGAILSGAPKEVSESLHAFGEALGIAFQIRDDVLDLTGQPELVGKSLGRDLAKGKLTLPLIVHLSALPPDELERSLALVEARDASALLDRLWSTGAIGAAQAQAETLVASARTRLKELPDSPARRLLDTMAEAVATREF